MKIKNYGPRERSIPRPKSRELYETAFKERVMEEEFMYARKRILGNEAFEGIDHRRRKELADGGMVMEDRNATSNLPMTPINREYVQSGFYCNNNIFLGDTELED